MKLNNEAVQNPENIELSLPINPAYVSAARLTASSIANRIGFDADEIEDVKAAVSEACIFIIKNSPADEKLFFKVVFNVAKNAVIIKFMCDRHLSREVDIENEMGLLMIKALMDELVVNEKGKFSIKIRKSHKTNEFG